MKVIPNAYYKSIYDIDYNMIKDKGYRILVFDVDNTLISYNEKCLCIELITLIEKLKNDFKIIVMSNRNKYRLDILSDLNVTIIYNAKKPLKKAYKKIINKYGKKECIFIGDNITTDILGAQRIGYNSILVDGFDTKKPIYVIVYNIVENIIKDKNFKRGNYFNNL